ncbi:MAG: putative 4-mercaptohistidine N1-methyltransferase [Verrucomicrobiota bacterium]
MNKTYETRELLDQYLLFHYGSAHEILPYDFGPVSALDYPKRCAELCLQAAAKNSDDPLPVNLRALDLGCAVGRSSFELARSCKEVIGIDFSESFVKAASHLKEHGQLEYKRTDEGSLNTSLLATAPVDIERSRVNFEQGDACDLRDHLSDFDIVLMANLIDRLPEPEACLTRLSGIIKAGGTLVITSPYTWMEEFTPTEKWLGGKKEITTLEGLQNKLKSDFEFDEVRDMPFLIREHVRKFQWSVAQASIWVRK